MEFTIFVYWIIYLILFLFMTRFSWGATVFWVIFTMVIWIYENHRVYSYIQKRYPEEYKKMTRGWPDPKETLNIYKRYEDDELEAKQKRFKHVLISIILWLVLSFLAYVIGLLLW